MVVSLDGFRHDYLDRYRPPALLRLAANGVRARGLIPPFPSKTLPSHLSMSTGLAPGEHGIVGNNFFDPTTERWFRLRDTIAARDGRWYGGEPIWVAAERRGIRTASYFWPGTNAAIGGVRPATWREFQATTPDSQRVAESIQWLRRSASERPRLLMVYLSEVDDTTHRHGPDAPQTAGSVAAIDRAVGRLLDSLRAMPFRDSIDVIVLSDHGMSDTPHDQVIPIRPALAAEGVDTTAVVLGDNGPVMSLWFGGDSALQRRAAAALRTRLQHATVYRRDEAPARWGLADNPRAGDLLVVGDLGYTITRSSEDRLRDLGSHGWDPQHRAMHGIFIAAGPRVRRATEVPAFENLQVFGLLRELLGLGARPGQGGGSPEGPSALSPAVRAILAD